MLPKLKLLYGIYTAQLSDPPPQVQDSFIDVGLQFNRVLKIDLR